MLVCKNWCVIHIFFSRGLQKKRIIVEWLPLTHMYTQTNTDTQTSRQTQRVLLSLPPWCRWMPLAADPESTLGHYNKQRGPTKAAKWRKQSSLGGELLSQPCGETTLTQSSVLVTQELDPLTHTHREELGQPLQSLLCCYDTALKKLIECIQKYWKYHSEKKRLQWK